MSILNMTLSASVMIIMIEILRVLTMRRLPKNLFRIFWAAAAVRLIVPFSFPFRFSAGTGFLYLVSCLAGTGSVLPFQGAAAEAFGGSAGKGGGTAAFFDIGDSGITGMFSSARFSDLPGGKIFLCIYLIGAAAAALWFSVNYVRSIRLFRESLPVSSICARRLAEKMKIRRGIDVRESEFIRSPLTYGIMHPVILLPKGISDIAEKDQMEYIFTHELVHVRRFDAVLKLILTAALCLHWFNPFVWIMYFLAARDIELACDESVIRILGKRSRTGYASMLVKFAEFGNNSSAASASFSRNALSERVVSIMDKPSFTPVRTAAAVLLFAVTVIVFATSPQPSAVRNWISDSASAYGNVWSNGNSGISQDMTTSSQSGRDVPASGENGTEQTEGLSGEAEAGAETTAVSSWNRPDENTGTNPPIRDYSQGTADSAENGTAQGDGSVSQSEIYGPASPGNLGGYDNVTVPDAAPEGGVSNNPLPASPGSLETYR